MIALKGDSFTEIYYKLLCEGVSERTELTDSRNGQVKDLGPAFFEISSSDTVRLPILEKRAFNPFFALTEFSWIISGSNNLKPLNYFIKNYNEFSDDGVTLNGAYGYRLRILHGTDQILKAIKILREDKHSRRVLITTWHVDDLGNSSKDIPCNVSIMFKIRNERLDMTVINRSNDLYLGVPYNVVVFYLLQCFIAKELGCKIGFQRHFTDSLHLYSKHLKIAKSIVKNNSLDNITRINEKSSEFELSSYITINHKSILDLNYQELDDTYKGFFESFELYKSNSDYIHAIRNLPKNQLGYAGYLWYKEKKNAIHVEDFFSNFK